MGTLREDQDTLFIIFHSVFLRMGNTADKSFRENQNTHFMFSKLFYWESWRLWDNVEKYCGAEQAPCDKKGQDHCIL